MITKSSAAIIIVFIGCCSNVIFLEFLIKSDPGIGNLVTFLQFSFIAIDGLIFTSKFGRITPKIPIKEYFTLVVMFFISSLCNNYAFDFNIPMPLHMIFRSGSLIANMIMGIVILNKRYEASKYVAVIVITIGIIMCTYASGYDLKDGRNSDLQEKGFSDFIWWLIGISLLTLALFTSARIGIYQEVMYKRYGKHTREALFYTHLLSLPGFLILINNIWDHAIISGQSTLIQITCLGDLSIPITWIHLVGNILTQYICISSVYVLTAECTSLTVTFVITLRKFASLLFSIFYFENPFTLCHWIGTLMVFSGSIIFTEILFKLRKSTDLKIGEIGAHVPYKSLDSV